MLMMIISRNDDSSGRTEVTFRQRDLASNVITAYVLEEQPADLRDGYVLVRRYIHFQNKKTTAPRS